MHPTMGNFLANKPKSISKKIRIGFQVIPESHNSIDEESFTRWKKSTEAIQEVGRPLWFQLLILSKLRFAV